MTQIKWFAAFELDGLSMPVVKLYVDATRKSHQAVVGETLREDVRAAVQKHLSPKPGTFQWLANWDGEVGGDYPVYLDIQFRASEARGGAVVDALLVDVENSIADHLGCPCRLRAFAIDQATLFARDSELA